MLIAVAGMVGSGKTTLAKRVWEALDAEGLDVTILRFQSLPCFTLLRTALKPPETADVQKGTGKPHRHQSIRWQGYQPKSLGFMTTAVYMARMLSFRVYALSLRRNRVFVLNRYFYDLFAHYRMETFAERACFRILRALMPVPDVAILAVATPDIISARRPEYSPEYVTAVSESYSRMRASFPELAEWRTDPGADNAKALQQLVVATRSRRSPRS